MKKILLIGFVIFFVLNGESQTKKKSVKKQIYRF